MCNQTLMLNKKRNLEFFFVAHFSSVTLQRHHRGGGEHVLPKLWFGNVATTIVQTSGLLGVLYLGLLHRQLTVFSPRIGAFLSRRRCEHLNQSTQKRTWTHSRVAGKGQLEWQRDAQELEPLREVGLGVLGKNFPALKRDDTKRQPLASV